MSLNISFLENFLGTQKSVRISHGERAEIDWQNDLTLKAPITTAADDIFFIFLFSFFIFQRVLTDDSHGRRFT